MEVAGCNYWPEETEPSMISSLWIMKIMRGEVTALWEAIIFCPLIRGTA